MEHGFERSNRSNFIIGFLLLLFGGLGLLNTFIPGLGLLLWAGIIGAGGLALLGFYAVDRREPALLIPVYILWTVAAFLALLTVPAFQGMLVPIYILTSIALPFLVGFTRNPARNWGLLIPAYVLLAVAGMLFGIERNILQDLMIPEYITSAIALPFLVGFTRNPAKNWGLLIPAYVLLAVAGMLFGIERNILQDLMIPAYITSAIALPFLLTFAVNRRNWWALIPGGIMSAIAVGFLAGTQLFSIGLPALLIVMGLLVLVAPMLFRRGHTAPQAEPMLAEPLRQYGPEFDKAPDSVDVNRL
jgi:hypothetical protein